jgi:uncharacterized membrane protein YkoI
MKRKFWFGLGGGVIVLALLILIIVLFVNPISGTTALTEQEALKVAEQRYSGTVKQIQQKEDEFVIELERDSVIYELRVHSLSGEVSSLKRIKEVGKPDAKLDHSNDPVLLKEEDIHTIALQTAKGKIESINLLNEGDDLIYQVVVNEGNTKTNLSIHAMSGDVLKKEVVDVTESQKRLTIEEATSIALEEVPGVVDDVDEETINGIAYYFVEVESSSNEREAIVEINAITKEVKSITWDDEGNDDGNDD